MKRTGFLDAMVPLRNVDDKGNAYVDPSLITHVIDAPSGKGCLIGLGGVGNIHVLEPADCVIDKLTLKRTKEYSPQYMLIILRLLHDQLESKRSLLGEVQGLVSARSILKANDMLPSDFNDNDSLEA